MNFIISAFLVLMLFSSALGYLVFIRKFLVLEDMVLSSREGSVYRSLAAERDHLDYTCMDWSVWDDSWLYMRDENPDFADSNLSLETLVLLNLNLMAFVRNDGSIKWQMEADLDNEVQRSDSDLPMDFFPGKMLDFAMLEEGTGITSIGNRVILLVSEPIIDGSEREEPAGYLVLGRELTPPVITRLSEMTNVDFQVGILDEILPSLSSDSSSILVKEGRLVEKGKKRMTSYTLADTHSSNSPRRIVTVVRQDRTLLDLGWEAFFIYLIITLAGVLAIALGVLHFLDRHYLNPVKNLYRNVIYIREKGDLSFRIPAGQNNEFGRLCEGVNSLLDVIQDQTNQLTEKNLYLHEQANTDELTGLFNKRFYRTWLDSREFSSSPDAGTTGAFLMVDIDHFKLYNDRYGHIAGDVCLRTVADLLRKVITRTTDIGCRYGGEEFLLILEDTDCKGAERVAEKIINGVRALEISNADSPTSPCLTVSIGICCGSFSDSPQVLDQLIQGADEALYASKTNGRNRYTVK